MPKSKIISKALDADKPRLPLTLYLPELVRLKKAGIDFILVAGQAVNFWANHFRKDQPLLEEFMPFVSKDVDLFGTYEDFYLIPKVLDGTLQRFKELFTPVMGVFTSRSEPSLMFELLRYVYGPVSTDKIRKRALIVGEIEVIDPVSLLISKCHNAAGIEQENRQDIRHVKMMVLAVKCHYSGGTRVIGKRMTPRQFINECKYLLDYADNHIFLSGLSMADATLSDCFPLAEIHTISTEHESIGRFYSNTLIPTIEKLSL
ncbi:MAG: hypothetical protein P1V20_17825 [Verrucomicrobiales bacterium]|nr:hypothetical protein [Verrucomicrobiales bacterium]